MIICPGTGSPAGNEMLTTAGGSGIVPLHTPAEHWSPVVAGSPSSQALPSLATTASQALLVSLQLPVLHWSPEPEQSVKPPPPQTPAVQVSPALQNTPSSQTVPSPTAGSLQTPVPGLQVPTAWHWSLAVQTTELAPVHVPAWQVSVWVHASLSSQLVPLPTAGSLHTPVPGSQVPVVWHWSLAVQVTGFEPVHTPAWQVSVCVHASPSSQAAPLAAAGSLQTPVPGSHVPSTWHWSLAVQVTRFEPLHTDETQMSWKVHTLPSSQATPVS